jgi:hypothetical protein
MPFAEMFCPRRPHRMLPALLLALWLTPGSLALVPVVSYGRIPADTGPFKLLLTEVCTLGGDQEFIEIWNPGLHNVDLSDCYLSDAVYSPNNTGYWNLGGGVLDANTVGGGAFADFTARFPAGYVLAAGDTVTISLAGSRRFTMAYGYAPDLELFEDGASPDVIPDLRNIFPAPGNSIINSDSFPSLTNSGECAILFHWREGQALVTDMDIFVYGAGGSYQFAKTGRTVAGVTYAPDTAVASQHPLVPAAVFGQSYARLDATEGTQVPTGSNGVDGRDELSEPWNVTWALRPASPVRPGPGIAAVGDDASVPAAARPLRCYPNPFNPRTTVAFDVPSAGPIRLAVYDAAGRLVRTLVAGAVPVGRHEVVWDGRDDRDRAVASGAYLCRLEAGGQRWSRHLLLLK